MNAKHDVWLDEFYESLCRKKAPANADERNAYVERLARCWSYHLAKTAEVRSEPVDEESLASDLHAGRDGDGRSLGGNPLRDVVLAEAVVRNEKAAVERFEEEYRADALDSMAAILGGDVRD
jgi:hypothetical protein